MYWEILYYEANEKMYKYNLRTGENEEFSTEPLSTTGCEFFVDENGIYLFNDSKGRLDIYDKMGNLLASVTDEQVSDCAFGKNGIFYGEVSDGSGRSAILEIEDVLNGDGKWLYIK